MNSISDSIDGERIFRALNGATIGREIIVLAETTSTNDEILQLRAAASEGLVVFAETQTAGRGQRGNRWESPASKGLWFSILLHPEIAIAESAALTTWAAEAIAAVLQDSYTVDARVKPPNDVYVGARKVAGVLVEMRARPALSHLAVLGVGINVNHAKDDFSESLRDRATSLALELGTMIQRNEVAIGVLQTLDKTYPFRKTPIRE